MGAGGEMGGRGWTVRAMRVHSREGGAETDIPPGREGPPTEYLLKGHCHIT